jgi:hypothetical protein
MCTKVHISAQDIMEQQRISFSLFLWKTRGKILPGHGSMKTTPWKILPGHGSNENHPLGIRYLNIRVKILPGHCSSENHHPGQRYLTTRGKILPGPPGQRYLNTRRRKSYQGMAAVKTIPWPKMTEHPRENLARAWQQ